MRRTDLLSYLLRVDGRVVSFHRTQDEAKEAAKRFPEDAELVIQTTHDELYTWHYDRSIGAWVNSYPKLWPF
jgi:hypothetical protein